MKNSSDIGKSAEDYLESMIILKEKNGYVRSIDIAGFLRHSTPYAVTSKSWASPQSQKRSNNLHKN